MSKNTNRHKTTEFQNKNLDRLSKLLSSRKSTPAQEKDPKPRIESDHRGGKKFKKESPYGKSFKKDSGERKKKDRFEKHSRDFKKADRPPRRGDRFESRTRGAPDGARGLLVLKANLDKNHKGFGFLIFEDRQYEDAYVPSEEAAPFFHGDRVEVTIDSRGEIQKLSLLTRRIQEVVGRFEPHPMGIEKGGWISINRRKFQEEVWVAEPPKGIQPRDWVRAKFEASRTQSGFVATILEVFGPDLPARQDVEMIAREFDLIEEHSSAAIAEAEALGKEVSEEDIEEREDLRHLPFMTIDGETARDFDDAVYVERNRSGYVLWVAIADVSHYVKPGSKIDEGAYARATSVYFPERAFHMLPRALSENLCSLKPHVNRLAMVSRIEFDHKGIRGEVSMHDAVIKSFRRATYTEIYAETLENKNNKSWNLRPHLELYSLLRDQRIKRGSIDFDLPEAEVLVDKDGEPIEILNRERNDAHRLIEEFMIAANEAVTDWIERRDWPFVYRVHEKPAGMAIKKFEGLAKTLGVAVNLSDGDPESFARFLKKIKNHPAEMVLNTALLRSLKQAVYSAGKESHFGLASPGYTHFTSPIRRYPDLIVHRLLRSALWSKKGAPKGKDRDKLQKELDEQCGHCSYRERLAAEADREAIRLKQTRIMLKHHGEIFDAEIVGFTENGFFVRTHSPFTEGFVNKDTLMDDVYTFNEEKMIFFGRRKRRTFRIGEKVRVQVVRADLEKRIIDFSLDSSI